MLIANIWRELWNKGRECRLSKRVCSYRNRIKLSKEKCRQSIRRKWPRNRICQSVEVIPRKWWKPHHGSLSAKWKNSSLKEDCNPGRGTWWAMCLFIFSFYSFGKEERRKTERGNLVKYLAEKIWIWKPQEESWWAKEQMERENPLKAAVSINKKK